MGSDVQHIEWVLCIDTNAVITVYFLIWCFFCTLHFCLDVISQNYYVIKFRICINCCVCCYGDDETAIFYFFFDISCIPYFIYKMRID